MPRVEPSVSLVHPQGRWNRPLPPRRPGGRWSMGSSQGRRFKGSGLRPVPPSPIAKSYSSGWSQTSRPTHGRPSRASSPQSSIIGPRLDASPPPALAPPRPGAGPRLPRWFASLPRAPLGVCEPGHALFPVPAQPLPSPCHAPLTTAPALIPRADLGLSLFLSPSFNCECRPDPHRSPPRSSSLQDSSLKSNPEPQPGRALRPAVNSSLGFAPA